MLSSNVADQVAQRSERDHLTAHRYAPADKQLGAGAPSSFRDERRLSDPRFPADQQNRRPALVRGRDGALEGSEFVAASDEVCG